MLRWFVYAEKIHIFWMNLLIIVLYLLYTKSDIFFALVSLFLIGIAILFPKLKYISFLLQIGVYLIDVNTWIWFSCYFYFLSYFPFIAVVFVPSQYVLYGVHIVMFLVYHYFNRYYDEIKTISLQRDELKSEILLLQQVQKKMFVENKESQLHAILNERNRISCEIHDHSGHIIASTIMQLSALKVQTKDEDLKNTYQLIQEKLQLAMKNIRSVLHNELILDNLKLEITKISQSFPQIDTTLSILCNSELKGKVISQISAITKEAYTNVIKHSNATKVCIQINENDQFLFYEFKDNGTNKKPNSVGIGLYSMRLRAESINAQLTITPDYTIHMRIRKDAL